MTNELQIIIKLFLAMLLGGLIGWERERDKRPAGFRTHILVCLGATLLISIALLVNNEMPGRSDVARIAAGIIMGIGFLGAGVIIQARGRVKGLTTAASVWLVAAIGIAIGYGFYFYAIVATIFAMITLMILFHLEKRFGWRDEKKDE